MSVIDRGGAAQLVLLLWRRPLPQSSSSGPRCTCLALVMGHRVRDAAIVVVWQSWGDGGWRELPGRQAAHDTASSSTGKHDTASSSAGRHDTARHTEREDANAKLARPPYPGPSLWGVLALHHWFDTCQEWRSSQDSHGVKERSLLMSLAQGQGLPPAQQDP
ncbi:hypothetical protein EV126DRAFT_159447 [Verticillium dahliae]|nr:hypothetical protein EV126DRAFT_159447 [Verticillium dahliae]